MKQNRVINDNDFYIPVCNLPGEDQYDEQLESQPFDEAEEIEKLYHYPCSRRMNKYTETFVCPDEFYMGEWSFLASKFAPEDGGFFATGSSKFWHGFNISRFICLY